MKTLKVLSGGAAQGLVEAFAPQLEAEAAFTIDGSFGAVGGMAARLRGGEPADLLILTSALIEALTREGHLVPGSARDLGTVHTAVAVRAGDPVPSVADEAGLRSALVAADAIYFPDPQQATAGIHFAKVLEALGIADHVRPWLKTFPNGATAMRELAASPSARPIGCTQVTEILNTPGLSLAGMLPEPHGLATVYTGAVCTNAAAPDAAQHLLALLTAEAAREARRRAGFAEG